MEEKEDTIYLKSKVNELFATTELTQYFTNHLDNAIELSISFPIKEEINISKFTISIDEKVYISKVMKKEKAEEKYADTVASGNIGLISKFKDDNMNDCIVNIGNINPKQKVKLNTTFIQMIGSQDMSYEFNIMEKYPSFQYEGLNESEIGTKNKIINAIFTIETMSKITRLIAPFYDEEAKKYSTYEVAFSNDYTKAEIKYIKNPYTKEDINENKINKATILSSFCLLFRTEKMNNPILFYQYNPEFKEIAYSINYVYSSDSLKNIPTPSEPDQDNKISYFSKYQESTSNQSPGLFIFLIDQSGSMSGESIQIVKETLLEVINSLKFGSYFQLIGFGSDFKKYNEEPIECQKENIKNMINIINNLDADMGGTNISSPLEDIYNKSNYTNINLSKNLFILTDGEVDDREKCIDLITTNSNKFRVHAFGIGKYFDKILIEKAGQLGKGSSSFVEKIEQIKSIVISKLNDFLRPYISDVNFEFPNYQINQKSIICCNPINNFTYLDEIMNYSFILDENNKNDIDNLNGKINVKIIGKEQNKNMEENVSFEKNNNIIKLSDGDEMTKIIIGKALKYNKDLLNDKKKEIEFATKYQILSKNTALFAEILNNNIKEQTKLEKINLNEKPKKEKITKLDNLGKNFSCQCGKSYLSLPALYIHIKTKHPELCEGNPKRGRGRARKITPIKSDDFETTKYKPFFNKTERSSNEEGKIDIIPIVQEVFKNIYESPSSNKLFSKPKTYKDNPILENLVIKKNVENKKKKEKSCDDIFYEYISSFMNKTNKKYFVLMLKFILLFRECYYSNKKISENNSPEGLPDLCNEFYEFIECNSFFENNEDISEIIELIQHFCIWLYKNQYTKSKLSLCS